MIRPIYEYIIDKDDWKDVTGERSSGDVVVRKVVAGPYTGEAHKDRCAAIGLLVSRTLNLQDASPREVDARVDSMRMGLQIIATWASCDSGNRQDRRSAMEDIRKRAMVSLGKEVG